MSDNLRYVLLNGLRVGIVFGTAAYIFLTASSCLDHQEELAEEIFSRLEECEKNLDRSKQIQKLLHSRLEICEKNHELKE